MLKFEESTMSRISKAALVVLLVATITTPLLAGTSQKIWIVDDFESYGSTEDMLAGPFEGPLSLFNRGWWNVYSLQQEMAVEDPTPPFPTIMSLAVGDPNGFSAEGEINDHPTDPNEHGMMIHYSLLDDGWNEANFLIMTLNMGIPTHNIESVVGPIPAVDFTQFDKLQFKIKKLAGNITDPTESAITIAFGTVDLNPDDPFPTIGFYRAEIPAGILASSEDVWEIIEFDLSAPMEAAHDTFGLDRVITFMIGIEDAKSADVTFVIDDSHCQ